MATCENGPCRGERCLAPSMSTDLILPSKLCTFKAHLADKAYASAGEAASTLHFMAILQVFQAKLRQSLDGGIVDVDVVKYLPVA